MRRQTKVWDAEENSTTTDALWTIYFTHYDLPKQQLLPESFM